MNQDLNETLDCCSTELGELLLRRRRLSWLGGVEAFEILLDGHFLMTSLVTDSEVALADLALADLSGDAVDVVVGGLGLGHTAAAVLAHANVRSLLVVEALRPVIEWHRRGLVPLGPDLTNDDRCRLIHGDFFELAANRARGFDDRHPARRFDAVLVDIDDSPSLLLHSRHARFYRTRQLQRLKRQLRPGGVFALWTTHPTPDDALVRTLDKAFSSAEAHQVPYLSPTRNYRPEAHTIYIARNGMGSARLPQRLIAGGKKSWRT